MYKHYTLLLKLRHFNQSPFYPSHDVTKVLTSANAREIGERNGVSV